MKIALIILFLTVFTLSCKTTQKSMEKISLSGFFIQSFDKYGNCIMFVESNFECIDSFLKNECLEVNIMPKMDTLNFFDAIKNIPINSDSIDRVRYSKKVFEFKLNKSRNVANFYSNLEKNYDSAGNLLLVYKSFKNVKFTIIHSQPSKVVYPKYPTYYLAYKNSKYHFFSIENPPYDIIIW